jgi:hypothetical protein
MATCCSHSSSSSSTSKEWDEEPAIRVGAEPGRAEIQFHWTYDLIPLLDVADRLVSLPLKAGEQSIVDATKADRIALVYAEYFATRPRHQETFIHDCGTREETLCREKDIPSDVFHRVIDSLLQLLNEPNTVSRGPLPAWLKRHPDFRFAHLTDYQPVYRGPN